MGSIFDWWKSATKVVDDRGSLAGRYYPVQVLGDETKTIQPALPTFQVTMSWDSLSLDSWDGL